jgi:hypothetical protein
VTVAGAAKDGLRAAWRWPVLALALLLAACQTSSSGLDLLSRAAPVDNVPPAAPGPPQPTVSEELFQPTVHAILAMSGGFGTAKSATAVETVWQRKGSEERFTASLMPDRVEVKTLKPGHYALVKAVADGNDLLAEQGSDARPLAVELSLDPGDVVYIGKLLLREETRRRKVKKDGKTATQEVKRVVLDVQDDMKSAKAAVSEVHPLQAPALKRRLVKRAS